eukprot:m.229982 g.229982  ORF g.229982 m.229982 type:complete len:510 (+) comp54262_c0_seq1:206-1735(+)
MRFTINIKKVSDQFKTHLRENLESVTLDIDPDTFLCVDAIDHCAKLLQLSRDDIALALYSINAIPESAGLDESSRTQIRNKGSVMLMERFGLVVPLSHEPLSSLTLLMQQPRKTVHVFLLCARCRCDPFAEQGEMAEKPRVATCAGVHLCESHIRNVRTLRKRVRADTDARMANLVVDFAQAPAFRSSAAQHGFVEGITLSSRAGAAPELCFSLTPYAQFDARLHLSCDSVITVETDQGIFERDLPRLRGPDAAMLLDVPFDTRVAADNTNAYEQCIPLSADGQSSRMLVLHRHRRHLQSREILETIATPIFPWQLAELEQLRGDLSSSFTATWLKLFFTYRIDYELREHLALFPGDVLSNLFLSHVSEWMQADERMLSKFLFHFFSEPICGEEAAELRVVAGLIFGNLTTCLNCGADWARGAFSHHCTRCDGGALVKAGAQTGSLLYRNLVHCMVPSEVFFQLSTWTAVEGGAEPQAPPQTLPQLEGFLDFGDVDGRLLDEILSQLLP